MERQPKPNVFKPLFFWILIFLIIWGGYFLFTQREKEVEISYNRFIEELDKGNIEAVTIREKDITGTLKKPITLTQDPDKKPFLKFKSYIPFEDPGLVNRLISRGVEVVGKGKSQWTSILITLLPWAALIGIWILLMRGAKEKISGPFSFSRSKAKLINERKPKITFKDVAGIDEAKEELQDVISFLKSPKRFTKLGGRIPKGIIIIGAPGTGKTLLARAVAGEAGVPFLSISGSNFVELFVGVGAARVRDLFEQAKRLAPCIIFIDEIDAVGRARGAGLGGGHDEREQTLNQLLVEMDGFETSSGVIIMSATNRPDILDSALLRPGRFDRKIVLDRPDVKGREEILKVHTRKVPLVKDVDLSVIARGTPGFTGADLESMVNEAALLAARRGKNEVDMKDFEDAKDKILMGTERKSFLLSEEEKRVTAYHETGHALVAKLIKGLDPIHKVTIIPRGMAIGVTQSLPMDEKKIYPKSYCENQLVFMLGGRVAEELVLNDISTGAANDLEKTTELARKMVCEWGMSEKLGPLTFGKVEKEIFLGKELGMHRNFSEETARIIDSEVKRIIEKQYKRAKELLSKNRELLDELANELLEKEVLTGEEIDKLIDSKRWTKKESKT